MVSTTSWCGEFETGARLAMSTPTHQGPAPFTIQMDVLVDAVRELQTAIVGLAR